MLDLIGAMAAVLLSWALLLLMFSGLGMIALGLLGMMPRDGWLWLDAFWLGWAAALGLMQLWHVAFPVNDEFLLLLAAIALLALLWRRRMLLAVLRRAARDRLLPLLLAILAIWLASRALGMSNAYDSGFRDMQAVMWADAYPLAPGLGNLFSSLAFNQSVYLYDALLDAFFWAGRSQHIATGLLLLAYLLLAVKAALCFFRCRNARDMRWSWLFALLTMPYALFISAPYGGLSHFLTDTVVDLLGFVCMIYLLEFLQGQPATGRGSDYPLQRLAIIILAGFTIKQSFALFGLALGIFAAFVWFKRHGLTRMTARCLAPVIVAACAFMLPWLGRGIVTSGYVAFPQTFGRLDVDWAIPEQQLRQRQLNMSANTRLRGADRDMVLNSWQWLGPWLRGLLSNVMSSLLPMLIAGLGLCAWVLGRWRGRGQKRASPMSAWTLTPLVASLLIWFFTFPEPKYARYIFWSQAALACILALDAWPTLPFAKRKALALLPAALCLAYALYFALRVGIIPPLAGAGAGFHARPPAAYHSFVTESGLAINVPESYLGQCWRIPLPCAPSPDPKLEARVPGELRHGFRLAAEADDA